MRGSCAYSAAQTSSCPYIISIALRGSMTNPIGLSRVDGCRIIRLLLSYRAEAVMIRQVSAYVFLTLCVQAFT